MVYTPKEFSDATIKFVSSITTVYSPKSDKIVEPESDGGRPGSLSHSVVQKS